MEYGYYYCVGVSGMMILIFIFGPPVFNYFKQGLPPLLQQLQSRSPRLVNQQSPQRRQHPIQQALELFQPVRAIPFRYFENLQGLS